MQFERHTADKFYLALIDGVLHHDEGEIDKPIGEHPTVSGKMTVSNSGKPSLTFYRVIERFKRFHPRGSAHQNGPHAPDKGAFSKHRLPSSSTPCTGAGRRFISPK